MATQQANDKPSWWIRTRRKKLIEELQITLKDLGIRKAWVHNHFINAQDRKAKHITIYIDFANQENQSNIEPTSLDYLMDKKFKRKKVSIIDIASFQPAIKEFVFKDLTSLL
jgi:hypothetical protein